ncbi:coiled-coil domain-containing protein, partial [Streptomyces sp. NPDC058682]|uniref:coiled-coil domain-containing protein n=1 Tax=Streptomyces sp. NPDC058682 TaxID=3346596 RepID=UPI0036663D37
MASHRRAGLGSLDRSTKITVLTAAAAATAAVAMTGVPANAAPGFPYEPGGGARTGISAQVDRLFEEAEQATERFNEAGEKADRLRVEVNRAQDAVARGQERINTLRGVLGTFAGAQYRGGGIDPAVGLMLAQDPDAYLERAAALDRLTGRQARQLDELREEQRELGQERQEASRKLAELDALRSDVARHKSSVTAKLAAARRLLNAMPSGERADYERSSRSGGRPEGLPEPGSLGPSSGRAPGAGWGARAPGGRPGGWGSPRPPRWGGTGRL